jgi:predicted enzyme related to lactoylglutathione lyase
MREQTERVSAPSWLPFFTVENTDEAAARAEQLGGRRVTPTTKTHVDHFAVVADPHGAAFAAFECETDP